MLGKFRGELNTVPSDSELDLESDLSRAANGPFGPFGAINYDTDARRMARRYKSAHSIQNALVMLSATDVHDRSQSIFVDLGCGTGTDALNILKRCGRVAFVGVDSSTEMLQIARDKFRNRGIEKRVLLLNQDFRNISASSLLSAIHAEWPTSKPFCVMSSMSLHHYTLDEKLPIYQLAYSVLRAGGLLVLTDLYSNALSFCAEYALNRELTDIRAALSRIHRNDSHQCGYPTTLSERHYRHENTLVLLSDEISLLRRVGFEKMDVVFRDGQLAVIVAAR